MKKRTVKILTGIAIVLVVLGLIYAIAVSVSSAKLRRAYADLKKDGRPMEPADVIPPKVSDTENAALLYQSAALLLKAQPAPDNNLLKHLGDLSKTFIKETLDSDKFTELKELIDQEEVTQALSIVEQGTRRGSCRFDHDYDAGLSMLLPHLSDMRNLARILCAKAYFEAETGNPDNAWDMVTTQLKFANALKTEPVLVSQIVRMAMVRLSCDTIKKLCEIAPPSVQQTSDIQSLLKDFDDIRPLIHSIDADRLLIGEWLFNLPKLELIKQEDLLSQYSPRYKLGIIRTFFKPTFLSDHAAYLRFMHEAARFIEHPNARKQLDILEKEIEKRRYSITPMLIFSIFRFKQIHCEMIAQLRIVQAGLALLQYKQKQDAFPATLEALKLQNISDPYSDGLLLYKTEGQGFILYSVGPDQKDNNGSPRQDKQEKDWDIVWIFPG